MKKSLSRLSSPTILAFSAILALSSCRIGDLKVKQSDVNELKLSSALITNPNPSLSSNFNLSFGNISAAYDSYCIQENSTEVSLCSWVHGSLPASYAVSSVQNSKVLSIWLRDAQGRTSKRIDTNSCAFTVLKLATKNLSGSPNGSSTISFSGSSPSNLQFRFIDRNTHQIVKSSSVSGSGGISLPSKAGLYETELYDSTSGKSSFGQATITTAVASWVSNQTLTPSAFGSYRVWPDYSRAIGDYTGDGYLDFAVAEGTNGSGTSTNPGIYLYKYNSAAGTYSLDTRLVSTSGYIYGLRFADLNGDGALDLVYGRFDPVTYAGGICYLVNSGSGTFGAPNCVYDSGTSSTNRTYYYDIEVADIDNDGRLDVVAVGGNHNGSAWVASRLAHFHNTGGGFVQSSVISIPSSIRFTQVRVGDVDDDGLRDIVALQGDNVAGDQLYIFWQSASGTFSSGTASSIAASSTGLFTMGYLNGDTKLDFILNSQGSTGGWYLASNATDNTYAATSLSAPTELFSGIPTIADLAQTGSPKVYFAPKNRLLYNNKSGIYFSSLAGLSSLSVNAGSSIVGATNLSNWQEANFDFVDTNNDGKLDMILFSSYGAEFGTSFFEFIRGQ